MNKAVSIVIVNYNTADVLRDCIESVFKFEDPAAFEIIIVDNGSTDDSAERIREISQKYSSIKTILPESPGSFSLANNKGIELSDGEYVIIMNPDILFTEPLLVKLISDFEEPGQGKLLGALTPALVGTDGKFQRNYFQRYPGLIQYYLFYTIWAKIFFRFPSLMNRWLENQDVDIAQKKMWYVEQVPCAFFMTKRKIMEEVGMMDSNIVLFFEDVDLSYRIHKKYKLGVDARMQVTHLGGTSFKTEDNWWMLGRFTASLHYFFRKHYGGPRAFVLKYMAISNSVLTILIEMLKKIIGRSNKYRILKHRHLIKLLSSSKEMH